MGIYSIKLGENKILKFLNKLPACLIDSDIENLRTNLKRKI